MEVTDANDVIDLLPLNAILLSATNAAGETTATDLQRWVYAGDQRNVGETHLVEFGPGPYLTIADSPTFDGWVGFWPVRQVQTTNDAVIVTGPRGTITMRPSPEHYLVALHYGTASPAQPDSCWWWSALHGRVESRYVRGREASSEDIGSAFTHISSADGFARVVRHLARDSLQHEWKGVTYLRSSLPWAAVDEAEIGYRPGSAVTDRIGFARRMAEIAHRGQLDKAGRPYIEHPARVAGRLSDEDAVIVAFLHDVVEDTDITLDQIEALFGDRVRGAVEAITRRCGEGDAYYARINANALARAVKLEDLADNADPARLSQLSDGTRSSLEAKYNHARAMLEQS